ncbi:hypothetical protein EW026_g2309 [Hermanssonia centrifuga]|uniref:Uncharacterized protein n=1 Tax=Hermanssonia centrifuga TaxID=98765 RepID=A0A4S4KPP0_9APHY|nr:hypothetical protein EW026_g2309 [Hermanssonia centrifuga]
MASRFSRTLFARVARPTLRASRGNMGKRMMSEVHGAHSPKASSDLPWIIGSALVFGPAALYLLTPSSDKKAHETAEHALPKKKESSSESAPSPDAADLPTKDDEGDELPASEVEASARHAFNEDSPKDAQEHESGAVVKDDSEAAEEPKGEDEAAGESKSEADTEKSTEERPSDQGAARVQSVSGKDPKDAAKEDSKKDE